ncbi:MAG: tRNA uridine-5-carboxymethylaminomethyl(34) synthesis GTPase MnmE, partial [Methylomonas sp.]
MKTGDTIAAIATPPGNGGVGIIRISGPAALDIARHITGKHPKPRYALFSCFLDNDGSTLDSGLALYFPGPASFTGEDILELQGHGGSVVMDMLLRRVLSLGARTANPGEFSQRAFLNNKIDLAQAEAIADLITSGTEQAVRSAQQSMQGLFSEQINELIDELIELRVYIEAAIDFVDEEIDFLSDGMVAGKIEQLSQKIAKIHATAQQGRLLHDGMTVVLAGRPNAGKSSLLNALAGFDAAIVTDIAGTTRDVLRERIQIDGMPLHIIDTAGLRDSDNIVEQEGIRRAHREIEKADKVLLLLDSTKPENGALTDSLPTTANITRIFNKIDLSGEPARILDTDKGTDIYLSIRTGAGMDLLKQHLK